MEEEFLVGETVVLPIPEGTENGIINVICHCRENRECLSRYYYLNEAYGTILMETFPPLPMVGSIVQARCYPEGIGDDAYCRWFLEDELLGEGYLSQGGGDICFYGPQKKGSYSLRAELFPHEPLERGDVSPWAGRTEIFFDERAERAGVQLSGPWTHLFLCDGTHIDRGASARDGGGAMDLVGRNLLGPTVAGGDRGYRFGSDSYLKYDGKMLQGLGAARGMVYMKMALDPSAGQRVTTEQIFSSRDGLDQFSITLFRKEESFLLSLGSQGGFVRSRLDFPPGLGEEPFRLGLEWEKREEKLLIRWYLDTILIKEDILVGLAVPVRFSGGGSTVWGREYYPSFRGVLFEWGFAETPEGTTNE